LALKPTGCHGEKSIVFVAANDTGEGGILLMILLRKNPAAASGKGRVRKARF
jgi:hypothetical protein